jgi:hypothetical protein
MLPVQVDPPPPKQYEPGHRHDGEQVTLQKKRQGDDDRAQTWGQRPISGPVTRRGAK